MMNTLLAAFIFEGACYVQQEANIDWVKQLLTKFIFHPKSFELPPPFLFGNSSEACLATPSCALARSIGLVIGKSATSPSSPPVDAAPLPTNHKPTSLQGCGWLIPRQQPITSYRFPITNVFSRNWTLSSFSSGLREFVWVHIPFRKTFKRLISHQPITSSTIKITNFANRFRKGLSTVELFYMGSGRSL